VTTTVARVLLFLSSYAPLAWLLAVREVGEDNAAAVVLVALGLAGVPALLAARRLIRSGTSFNLSVSHAEPLRESSAAYLATYVLPFLLIDLSDSKAVIAAGLFVLIIGVIYVRSRLIYLNPMVALAGYVLWRLDGTLNPGANPVSLLVVSRLSVETGMTVRVLRADQEVWLLDG